MVNHQSNNIFDFESIVCIPIGCIVYILKTDSVRDEYFKDHMKDPSLSILKNLYVGSDEQNPIKWLLRDEYISSADEILVDLYKNHYRGILNHSIPTDVMRLIRTYRKVEESGINITINCHDEIQKEIAKAIESDFKVVVDEYEMEQYTSVYTAYSSTAQKYKSGLEGKHVYIHNIRVNYDEKNRLEEGLKGLIRGNVIHTIDPYIGYPLYLPPYKEREANGV